ncbi:tetratricopeptide repeat protein [Candidatus Gottesmanbacteria bacterium]|nr:tetratricopeptide repeat protein [Candidatus Gottesmanbacteria bacterium]
MIRWPFQKYPWLLIFAFGLIVYSKALFNPFVWDDQELIVNNASIKTSSFISYAISGGNFNSGGLRILTGNYYKPLMSITYGINYRIWGLSSFGYHLFQIFLHLINTVLVFYLFKKLFRFSKYQASHNLALIGSLVFLVHPLGVEAVGYIAATQEVLYTFFTLSTLSLILFLDTRRVTHFWQILIFSSLIFLSLLSKESGLIVILLGLILCLLLARKTLLFFFFSSIAATVFYVWLRFHFLGFSLPWKGIFPMMNASLSQRLITLPKEFTYYLSNFFYPQNLAISQHWLVTELTFKDFYFPLILLIVFIALIFFLAVKLKSKVFVFFALWFFGSLLMVLNIIPLDMTVADRWFYFPMIGLLGMIISSSFWGPASWRGLQNRFWTSPSTPSSRPRGSGPRGQNDEKLKMLFTLVIISLLLLLSFRTYLRLFDWQSPFSLYSHDAKINPGAFDLENNLGTELFRQGKFEEAKIHFAKSLNLLPAWWVSANNLGAYYDNQGDLENAEKYYRLSIANGYYYLAYENLAFVLLRQGKIDEAITFAKNSLRLFPGNARLILAINLGKENKH